MRLNKYIAHSGLTSRRKADALVLNGNVKVNGQVWKEPGYDVRPDDMVEVNGRPIHTEADWVYLMVNKPKGMVTTMHDEKERPVVADLVQDIPERIYPVGRLDFNTTGLLLMTNDGDLAHRLAHPAHRVGKTYRRPDRKSVV